MEETTKTPVPRKKVLKKGTEQEEERLDIVIDPVYNMFKISAQGRLPKELSGHWTEEYLAKKAIQDYLRLKRIPS